MRTVARLLFLALLAAPVLAPAQPPEALFNLVSLSAQAEREVPNDLLSAVLAAEAEGPDPAPLADAVNRAMQRAIALAQGYRGVKARSGAYQTFPVYDKNRFARWRVRQELRLESSEFAAATELVGKLQASLVVASLALTVSNEARRQAENALMIEAIAAFEERARIARDALKAKAYRVKDLQISGGAQLMPMLRMAPRAALAAEAMAAPAVEPGTTRIVITASGTVQLQ